MGAGQSDLYKGTYGDKPENIPDELKGKVNLPNEESKLNHIFSNHKGHLPDTSENRKTLIDLANDVKYHLGKDKWGNEWNARINNDGTQDWVEHRKQEIWDGGRNSTPLKWDNKTGLKYNPLR